MEPNDKRNTLEGKLVKSLKVKDLGELAADYAELGLDSTFDEGLVKDIPIVRTLVSMAKIGANIRDRLYVRKITRFLAQVGSTTEEQRQAFVDKYCADTRKFEEAVLLILEQADNMEKSSLIGKVFKACILGKMAFWRDLEKLLDGIELPENCQQRLFMAGLYRLKGRPLHLDSSAEFKYERNEYAVALALIHKEKFNEL
jgi:hypothetical protein